MRHIKQPNTILFLAPLILGALILAACGAGDAAPAVSPATQAAAQLKGAQVFARNCAACHATVPDTVIVGPSLAGIARTAATRVEGLDAQAYLRASITHPDAYLVEGFPNLMPPTFGQTLTPDELDNLIAYLLTLE